MELIKILSHCFYVGDHFNVREKSDCNSLLFNAPKQIFLIWIFTIQIFLFSIVFLFLFSLFNCCSSTVDSIFLPTTPATPPILPPTLDPTPLGFVLVSFLHVPWWPFPYCLPIIPLLPPLWLLSVLVSFWYCLRI